MIHVRLLAPGDEARAEVFLARHADSSMFLRANLRAAGLVDRGEPLQATWAAALDGERIVALAAHAWNGTVLVQAPEALPDVVRAAVRATGGRAVEAIVGPYEQTLEARDALGLRERAVASDSREVLYALDLAALRDVPASSATRRTREADLERCFAWREEYCIELLGLARSPELARRARGSIELQHARGEAFVLEHEGEIVAYSAFNARLPDVVQVGGVWTPVALRGRGYARAVVGGSLRIAREEGARRAVLFTSEDNVPAQRAYEALGFTSCGTYGLLFFAP